MFLYYHFNKGNLFIRYDRLSKLPLWDLFIFIIPSKNFKPSSIAYPAFIFIIMFLLFLLNFWISPFSIRPSIPGKTCTDSILFNSSIFIVIISFIWFPILKTLDGQCNSSGTRRLNFLNSDAFTGLISPFPAGKLRLKTFRWGIQISLHTSHSATALRLMGPFF